MGKKNLKKELKYLRKNADKFYAKRHPAEAMHTKLVSIFLKRRLKDAALEKERVVPFHYQMRGMLKRKDTKEEINFDITLGDYIKFAKDNKLKVRLLDNYDKRVYSKKNYDRVKYVIFYI